MLFNELNAQTSFKKINNAHAQNEIVHAHLPRYNWRTNISNKISNVRINTMVQFKPGLLISSATGLHHTSRQLSVTNGYK